MQLVNRPDLDFRGYAGIIASGRCARTTTSGCCPSGRDSPGRAIVTADGDLPAAEAGQSVTLTLDREIDVSRGD